MSRTYAIADRAEAEDYLRDPALCERYLDIISAIEDQLSRGVALEDLMGSAIDAQKLASSLTLFGDVAASLSEQESEPSFGAIARAARDLLTVTASQGYPACEFTRGALMRGPEDRPASGQDTRLPIPTLGCVPSAGGPRASWPAGRSQRRTPVLAACDRSPLGSPRAIGPGLSLRWRPPLRAGVRRSRSALLQRPGGQAARGRPARRHTTRRCSASRPRLRVSRKAAVFVQRQFRLRREIPAAVGACSNRRFARAGVRSSRSALSPEAARHPSITGRRSVPRAAGRRRSSGARLSSRTNPGRRRCCGCRCGTRRRGWRESAAPPPAASGLRDTTDAGPSCRSRTSVASRRIEGPD